MIESYISIAIILICFLLFRFFTKTNNQSTLSECSICNEVFDETQILEIESMPFCKEHAKTYIDNEWKVEDQVDCTPEMQEESVKLYEKKIDDYNKGKFGFIKTNYREDNGQIVTTLTYYTIKKEL